MPKVDTHTQKVCCLISEFLEETGLDREKARQFRRQILEGIILLCKWQLERIERGHGKDSGQKAQKQRSRKVPVTS